MKQKHVFITVAVSLGVGFAVAVLYYKQHQAKQATPAAARQSDKAATARTT